MSQFKTCQQCKAQIEAGAKFCPYCGFNNTLAPPVQPPGGMQHPPGAAPGQSPTPTAAGRPGAAGPPHGQQVQRPVGPPPQAANPPPYQGGLPPGQIGRAPMPPQGHQQYPPPQNDYQGTPPPGVYRPPQPRQKSPVGIIVLVVVLLALIAGGVFVYKSLSPGDNNQVQPAGGTSLLDKLLDSVKGEPSYDLSKPETYLPAPGLQMTYYEMYMDGDEGPLDLVTASIIPNALVSDASMFTDGDGEVYAGVCHYFKKADGGVYYIFDEDPSYSYPVLPALIQSGVSWIYTSEYGDVVYTIKQLGASCTLDCGTLTDCLVVEEDNQIFGTREASYYAPGMGLVLRQSIPDGANLYRLTSYQQMDAQEAKTILLTYCVNHEQINSQLSGQ